MTKNTTRLSRAAWLAIVSVLVSGIFFGVVNAQQGGSGGGSGSESSSGGGSGDQDQVQLRDKDQVHQEDGTGTGTPGVGDQDRLRDQDQVQLRDQDQIHQVDDIGITVPEVGGQDQDRLRDQDRLHTPTTSQSGGDGNQMQNQARVQLRASSSEGLGLYIQEQTRLQNQQQTGDVDEKVQLRNRAQVAVRTIQAAEEMLGQNGPRMSEVALEVNNATEGMIQKEESLQQRSWIRNFLFGQDKQVAQTIKQDAEQNRVRIQEMNQLLVNCGECDGEVKTMLQEQLQTMSQEQDRLNIIAEEAMNKRGILGWLFGN